MSDPSADAPPPDTTAAAAAAEAFHAAMRGLTRAAVVLVVLMLAASAAAYHALPPVLATHWDADGTANGWTPRPLAVLVMPAIAALALFVFRAAPAVDPRRANHERFAGTHRTIGIAALALLTGVHGVFLITGLGWPVPVERFATLAVGALLFVVGNVLPRVRPNYFVGIRTPWTLASDAVWTRTHRVGGYLFVGAGTVAIIAGLTGGRYATPVATAAALAAAFASVLYSYLAWRALRAPHAASTRPRP